MLASDCSYSFFSKFLWNFDFSSFIFSCFSYTLVVSCRHCFVEGIIKFFFVQCARRAPTSWKLWRVANSVTRDGQPSKRSSRPGANGSPSLRRSKMLPLRPPPLLPPPPPLPPLPPRPPRPPPPPPNKSLLVNLWRHPPNQQLQVCLTLIWRTIMVSHSS